MDRIKKLLILAIIIANGFFAIAQPATNETAIPLAMGEQIFVHTNTSTFLTGETLYCKLYCLNPNNQPSSISKIAYVELIENTRKSIFKQKVSLENGMAQGDFFLPTTLKTGNYKLIAYTKWMLNAGDSNLFEMDITVINPFQPLDPINQQQDASTEQALTEPGITAASNHIGFTIESNKKTYSQREQVNLKIKNAMGKGHYSVSVRRLDALPVRKQVTSKEFIKTASQNNPDGKIIYLPELRGELVSGSVISKKGVKDLNHKPVALSIIGKSFALKIVETDKLGRFTFILDKNPNLSNVVVQLVDDNRDDFTIQLDDMTVASVKELQFSPELKLDANLRNTIQERSIANQVENAYYAKKKDSIVADLTPGSFFHPLEKIYVLDDYTRFPTMKETITEVVVELYTKRNNNKYSIHLRNNVTNIEQFGPPLLLVDGLMVQDANELFDYNTENIYQIGVINEPYVYGPKTFSGVISIVTKNQDYQTKASGDFIKKLDIPRPLNQKQYYSPDYAKNPATRIPDYRTQLLWLPEITAEKPENAISFYSSDVSGQYEVVLEGFTDSGLPVSATNYFEIK